MRQPLPKRTRDQRSGPAPAGPAEQRPAVAPGDLGDPDVPPPPALPLQLLVPLVAAGGALGSVARYLVAAALPALPATVSVNLAGSFALGVLVGLRPAGRWSRPFIGTGVLGGFTTFSTFAVQTLRADRPVAALYVAVTLAGGLAAAALGLRLGGWQSR